METIQASLSSQEKRIGLGKGYRIPEDIGNGLLEGRSNTSPGKLGKLTGFF